MREILINLIRILYKAKQPLTASVLANQLAVSSRSIRNYVRELNLLLGVELIGATIKGYFLNEKEVARQLLMHNNQQEKQLPQTETERMYYILEELLKNVPSLNMFDLIERLYISYATLTNTISAANKYLNKYDLTLQSEKGELYLKGNENNKRRLMSHFLYGKFSSEAISLVYLEEYFGKETISLLVQLIKELSKQEDLKINDFSFKNLLLHLGIIIIRNKKGRKIEEKEESFSYSEKDSSMIKYITFLNFKFKLVT